MNTRQNRNHSRPESAVPRERRAAYRRAARGPTMGDHVARMVGCMADHETLLASGDLIHAAGAVLEIHACILALAGLTPASADEQRAKLALLDDIVPRLDDTGQSHIARMVDAAVAFERARDPLRDRWAVGRH